MAAIVLITRYLHSRTDSINYFSSAYLYSNIEQCILFYSSRNILFRSKKVFSISIPHTCIRITRYWQIFTHQRISSFAQRKYIIFQFHIFEFEIKRNGYYFTHQRIPLIKSFEVLITLLNCDGVVICIICRM